ncbi:MAG TPA: HU family DNA-binding protein [Oligoflexia bacterium]|nr:HU family DNA-binding protein [Oligoflexia bacterium]HMP27591.1 HU family DNA-binding protein [Oligoflexia bacterium]
MKPSKKTVATKKVAATKPVTKVTKTRVVTKPRNTNTLSYTYSEFLDNVRAFCGIEKRSAAKEMCEDVATFITESLRKGYTVPLFGLGKLRVRTSKARTGINPATKEMIQIPARKRVKFSPAKSLKESVL